MSQIVCDIVEVCVFARTETNDTHYLLLRRSLSEKIYPDIWQIVSGGIEREQNETALAAALRELKEETGLKPLRFWNLPYLNTFLDARKDIVHHAPVFVAEVLFDATPALSEEHYRFEWCTLERAKELLVWPGQIRALNIVHEYIVGNKKAAEFSEIII